MKLPQSTLVQSAQLEPNRLEAETFLAALDPDATSFTFQTFTDSKQARLLQKSRALIRIFHGSLIDHWQDLVALNRLGAGVFVTVNATDGKGRKIPNIKRIRAVWREVDVSNLPALPLAPSIVVESSPGKRHEYFLTDAIVSEKQSFETIMKDMVGTYGSDPNAKDLARVLRVPGFFHQKDDKPPTMVKILRCDGGRYELDVIKRAFCGPERSSDEPCNVLPFPLPDYIREMLADNPNIESEWPLDDASFDEFLRFRHAVEYLARQVVGGELWIDQRANWIRLGMALYHSTQNKSWGLTLWKQASQLSETWRKNPTAAAKECEEDWPSFDRASGPCRTIGSIYYEAEQHGWRQQGVLSEENGLKSVLKLDLVDGQVDWSYADTPPSRDFVYADVVMAGTHNVLAGYGGAMKTMFSLHAAVDIALGRSLLTLPHPSPGCSLLLLGEEDCRERDRRIGAIAEHYQLTLADKQLISQRVCALSLLGQDIKLTSKRNAGDVTRTGFGDEVISAAKRLAATSGVPCRLIAIDHAKLAAGGALNQNEDVTVFASEAARIALATGAAVLVLGHRRKPSNSQQQEERTADPFDVLGAGSFTDNFRLVLMLERPTEKRAGELGGKRDEMLELLVVKANYVSPGPLAVLKRVTVKTHQVGVLEPFQAVLAPAVSQHTAQRSKAQTKIIATICQFPGRYTKTSFRKTFGRTSSTVGVSEGVLRELVETLEDEGVIEIRPPTPLEQKEYGTRARDKVLVPRIGGLNPAGSVSIARGPDNSASGASASRVDNPAIPC